MTLDEAMRALRDTGGRLPRAAMRWLLDHWDEAEPPLIASLDVGATDDAIAEEDSMVAFFASHLLAEKAATAAYRPFCRMLHGPERSRDVLGDAITEGLGGLLRRLFDGDVEPLCALVQDQAADGYVRGCALLTLAVLNRDGRTPDFDMGAYLTRLCDDAATMNDETLWIAWADAVAMLGLDALVPKVRWVYATERIPPSYASYHHFEKDLADCRTATGLRKMLETHTMEPLTDAIGSLSRWYSFSTPSRPLDTHQPADPSTVFKITGQASAAIGLAGSQAFNRPVVGRNDPCPCGSGRKYKKCCLVAA